MIPKKAQDINLELFLVKYILSIYDCNGISGNLFLKLGALSL